MLDLLLLLDRVDGDDRGRQVEYFQRAQVEGVKRACALMVADLTRSYGVGELARLVGLSTTALKSHLVVLLDHQAGAEPVHEHGPRRVHGQEVLVSVPVHAAQAHESGGVEQDGAEC